MYLDSLQKSECCGCTACCSICPTKVIRMLKDDEGFAYPSIVEPDRCVHCGLCKTVCPFHASEVSNQTPDCFAGWLDDPEKRLMSTSGGAFTAIAEAANRNGYDCFFGATYDESGSVKHIGVPYANADALRGTKYVQSDPGDVFLQVKNCLNSGKKIVFFGTPCQVAGLQLYIGKKQRNQLLTVSLVCHGVASPAAFEKYRSEMRDAQHGTVQRVLFRDKILNPSNQVTVCTTLQYEDGFRIAERNNPYTTAFGLGLMQRPSCAECPFTTIHRNCDITIGDFWGLLSFCPEFCEEMRRGVSLILVHTQVGRDLITDLDRFSLKPCPPDWAVNDAQPQLQHPHPKNPRRDKFVKAVLLQKRSFVKTAEKEILRWRIKKKIASLLGRE